MIQLQTSLIAGMEITCKGEWRVHVTLKDEMAKDLFRLAHQQKRPMVELVRKALDLYLPTEKSSQSNHQQVLI